MAIQLRHAIIHSFEKNANSRIIERVVQKEDLLDINLPAVFALVDGISALLGRQGSSLTYGQFDNNGREGRFPSGFKVFSQNLGNDEAFLLLSHISLSELVASASDELLATGGHILVANYLSNGAPYVLVAMIKQRGGVSLDEDYVPVEITEIDLSKVYQAARINVGNFLAAGAANEREVDEVVEDERTYLSFIGQNKGNAASGYFVKALGCIKGISSSRATSTVIEAVHKFFREKEHLAPLKTKARDVVISYLQRASAANTLAKLEDIVHEVGAVVPGGMQDEMQGLHDYLNGENVKVPEQFSVHAQTLKRRIRIKGEDAQWSLQFEQQILGEDRGAKIYYDRQERTLTFNELGADLVSRIENELDNR